MADGLLIPVTGTKRAFSRTAVKRSDRGQFDGRHKSPHWYEGMARDGFNYVVNAAVSEEDGSGEGKWCAGSLTEVVCVVC